ncbi:hypothetical protein VD0002_g1956 [Verticillium dahliae]|uniref:Rhodopsin domain-containing protein n=2 Tax=Verticillium dahliae TaxID=27337 RepID=G2XGQ8_VERDV|nr:uncharacterized protein VDAG_09340 [Verticillium dahliae VdLs.17]KAF3346984.1 Metallocarboxypeptidase A-like protein [Verticillium dahliae VDG2]KAH6693020.1 hypothetical protein EV126DRAFT_390089 [Verticillium dahliae]EGY19006.1 hypothetical protein VDAG_09340 [Verticillium dahliae VdLs.17]PNH56310.1 hypothetical protein VD0003_g1374 [Verticillium dahliae]PNH67918.1 hypothetical protein VD0002_g1956 [Verticillium dahliae]
MSSKSQLPGLPGYNPDNLQPWVIQVVVSMTVLALASVVLRLFSRRFKGQELWWDDWMIIFSMGWNLAVIGFVFAMHSCGMGIHADLVDVEDIVMMAKWLVVAEVLYAWNLGWTKLSLLLMYYRIFRVPYFKRMAWGVGAFVMAWVVCITFLFIFICVPVEKLWYPHLPGRCINQVGTWIANAASTIFTDLVILLMPIPPIWKLQLKQIEKIGLTFAFSLGFFVVFASAYRTSVLFTYSATDPTYTLAPTVGWTAIEMSAGIVSACLPTLRPVMVFFARSLGIKGNLSDAFSRGASSMGLRSKKTGNFSQRLSSRDDFANKSAATLERSNKDENSRRASDDNESGFTNEELGTTMVSPIDAALRPDVKGYGFTVTSTPKADRGDDDADDIPLHSIRVDTKFKRSTTQA